MIATARATTSSGWSICRLRKSSTEEAQVIAQHKLGVDNRKGDILVIQRLQPLEWFDLFVFDEDVSLELRKAEHPFTNFNDGIRFVLERPEGLRFHFQRNGYLR